MALLRIHLPQFLCLPRICLWKLPFHSWMVLSHQVTFLDLSYRTMCPPLYPVILIRSTVVCIETFRMFYQTNFCCSFSLLPALFSEHTFNTHRVVGDGRKIPNLDLRDASVWCHFPECSWSSKFRSICRWFSSRYVDRRAGGSSRPYVSNKADYFLSSEPVPSRFINGVAIGLRIPFPSVWGYLQHAVLETWEHSWCGYASEFGIVLVLPACLT